MSLYSLGLLKEAQSLNLLRVLNLYEIVVRKPSVITADLAFKPSPGSESQLEGYCKSNDIVFKWSDRRNWKRLSILENTHHAIKIVYQKLQSDLEEKIKANPKFISPSVYDIAQICAE